MMRGRGRGTRLASATLVAMLAAAFAFSAPATAQDAPGDAPQDVSTSPTDSGGGSSDAPDPGASGGETDTAQTEPTETPEPGTEATETPPSESETTPGDATEPAEGTTPTEETDPAEPPSASEECIAGAAGCEAADEPACDAGATTAPPAGATESSAPPAAGTGSSGGCGEVVELAPEPTTPAPPPPAPTPPAAPAPQPSAPAPAANTIVLLITDAGPGPGAAPALPELANGLASDGGRLSSLIAAVVLDGSDETGATEAADEESSSAVDRALALARWSESMTSSQRQGPCAPLSSARMTALSDTCPSSQRESILTAGTQSSPMAVRNTLRAGLPPPDERLGRPRRTHPEAQSDPERPVVAVAPATSTRDHGRRLSGGGAPGGSSAAAGLRIFAVSTSPLLLTAPVTFPTEPQPSVFPEGEPGVPPPASPG